MARAWEQLRDIERANQSATDRRAGQRRGGCRAPAERRHADAAGSDRPRRTGADARSSRRADARRRSRRLGAAGRGGHAGIRPVRAARRADRAPDVPWRRRRRSSSAALKGEESVLPPLTTATAPRVSLIRSPAGREDVTTRRTAVYRRLVGGSEEATMAAALSAAQQAVDDAESASVGGMTFPAALEPARSAIRSDLAAFDLRPAQVEGLRALFDDPAKVEVASQVMRVVGAFVNKREIAAAVEFPRPGTTLDPGQLRIDVAAELRPSKYLGHRLARSNRRAIPAAGRSAATGHGASGVPGTAGAGAAAGSSERDPAGSRGVPDESRGAARDQPVVHRSIPGRRQPRDESRVPVARVPDRSARHAVQALLAASRRRMAATAGRSRRSRAGVSIAASAPTWPEDVERRRCSSSAVRCCGASRT